MNRDNNFGNNNKNFNQIYEQINSLNKIIYSLKQDNNKLNNVIQNLKQENQNIIINYTKINEDTQNQLNKKESEFNKLNNDYKNLLSNMNKISKENNDLKSNIQNISSQKDKQINELNDILRKKDYELNEKTYMLEKEIQEKNKLSKLNNELNKKIKDYEKIILQNKKELAETHKNYDEAINNFGQLTNEKKELEEENKSLKETIRNEKNFENRANQLQNIIDLNRTKEDYLKKKAEDFYDAIIDIDSINSLKKEGWQIKYNKERKEIYEKIISEETIKLGVLGINNVGKSYLLSKIAKVDIPTGYSIETKGISIKYSESKKGEEKGTCILDSAGFETPLLIGKEDKENRMNENDDKNKNIESLINRDIIEEELSKDKAQTERFIEELIISLSDIIILVVGKLTRTEQRLINRIKNIAKMNERNKIKSIIIVHNLAQYHRISEVENHIKEYLLNSATFNLIEKEVLGIEGVNDRNYLVEKSDKPDDKEIEVYHYIMAKEGTEAGDYYNELTIELIKQLYNHSNKRMAIDIPKEITLLFSDLSTEIIGEKIQIEKFEIKDNIIKLNENNVNDNNLNLNTNNTIIKSVYHLQNTYIDQDGKYLRNKEFEPKYSLYYYKEGEGEDDDDDGYENYLLLRLEIAGNIDKLTARRTNPKKEKYKGIVIKGHKMEDQFDEQKAKDFKKISDNRKYGEFSYFIELKDNLEIHKTYPIKDTDIYEFLFNNKNKAKDNNEPENKKKENANNNDIVEGKKIASGVYIMKFVLTQGSYA